MATKKPAKTQGSLRTYVPKGAKTAAASLRGRKSRIDAALDRATGGKRPRAKK